MNNLFSPPTFDDMLRLLRAWRFWLISALLGGLLGAGWYNLFPPDYRACATVVVDFNAEQAWPVDSDKELFYYLEREARKLEELAWADDTLRTVADETGFSIRELRTVKLDLSQPHDGAWHFYATDPDSLVAGQLASLWAESFVTQTRLGLASQSLGITPELQISPAQTQNLPLSRKTGLGTYGMAGAVILWVISSFMVLMFPRKTHAT